jgi:hypothetical protein
MHVAKVIVLLLLTLSVMRSVSWSIGWLLKHHTETKRLWIAVMSNTAGLIVFAGFLVTQRIPGEVIDLSALLFGFMVFTTYSLIDLRWTHWGAKRPGNGNAS